MMILLFTLLPVDLSDSLLSSFVEVSFEPLVGEVASECLGVVEQDEVRPVQCRVPSRPTCC